MNTLRALRLLALIEGLSFVVLLFIAMPLKYLFQEPAAVRAVGGIHGFLFLGFVASLLSVALDRRWPLPKSLKVFLASLLPFGFLWIEKHLRDEP